MKIEIVLTPDSLAEAVDLFAAMAAAGLDPDTKVDIDLEGETVTYDAKVEHDAKPAATVQAEETAEFDVVEEPPKAEEPKRRPDYVPPKTAAEPTVSDLRAAVRALIGRGGQTSWINDFLADLHVASVHDLSGPQRASLLEAINAR